MFFSEPFFWKSVTSPGCETAARSGGLPPSTAVESTVGVLSPVDRYVTLTFGYFFLKPFSTAWKCCCSAPVQTPTIFTAPETSDEPELAEPEDFFLPPHAVSASSATASTAASVNACRFTRVLLSRGLRRRRCLGPSPGRRSEGRVCRRRPSPCRPASRVSARRTGRRRPPPPRSRRSAARCPPHRRPCGARVSRPSPRGLP